MGLNFPNTPTVGDLYPSPAVLGLPVWRWDGAAWVATNNLTVGASSVAFNPGGNVAATNVQNAVLEVDAEKVAKAGDVMTGDLEIKKVTPEIYLNKTASGQDAGIFGMLNSKGRWFLDLGNGTAETGSNLGSDFALYRYDDAGSYLGAGLTVSRANGGSTFYGPMQVAGADYMAQVKFNNTQRNLTMVMRYGSDRLEWVNNANTAVIASMTDAGSMKLNGTGYTPNSAVDNAALVVAGSFGGGITLQDGAMRGSIWTQSGNLAFATSNDATPDVKLELRNGGDHRLTGDLYLGSVVLQGGNFNSMGGSYYYENTWAVRSWWDGSYIQFSHSINSPNNTITTKTLAASQNVSSSNWITCGGDLYTGYNNVNSGTLWFGNNTTRNFTCDGSGNYIFNGAANFYPNCAVRAPQLRCTTEQGVFVDSYGWTGAAYLCSLVQGNPNWGNVVYQAVHFPGAWAGARIDAGGSQFDFRNGGEAYKNGGAAYWQVISDARTKDVKGNYQHGLDAVCALNPVVYSLKNNYSSDPPSKEPREAPTPLYGVGAEYVGLLAQDAEIPMPELFKQAKGWIDGVEVPDLRSAEYTPLMFALVNCIKELKARIEVLEAR